MKTFRCRCLFGLVSLLAILRAMVEDRSAEPVKLSGEVRSEGLPLEGVEVRFKGKGGMVHTDRQGRFNLPSQSGASTRVTAAKPGYFIAGSPADSLPLLLNLRRLPAEDCERYTWVDPVPDPGKPERCGNCHPEIYREWSASSHARAAVNRRFLNLFDGSDWQGKAGAGWNLLADHKDGAGVCTACHAPTVNFTDPAYFDLRRAKGVDAHGVHCDYCHKIADAATENVGLTHGRYGLSLLRPSKGQVFFGPLADVDRDEDAFSPLYKESRYCASCHEGTIFGVHVYSTYSEWVDSPARRAGKQCQTCHMTPTGRMTNIAPDKGGIERDPQTLANHRFFGGSQGEMLRHSLHVSVVLHSSLEDMQAAVETTALEVGHRLPTGFVDRNLVLVVDALGADDRAVSPKKGPVLPSAAGEDLSGRPGRLYAKLLRDFAGHSPSPFWQPPAGIADTRLLPEKPDRADFTYPPGVKKVRVRLLYRRFWPEVARIKHWPDDEVIVVDKTLEVTSGEEKRWKAP